MYIRAHIIIIDINIGYGFDLIKKEVIPTPRQVDYTCFIFNRTL